MAKIFELLSKRDKNNITVERLTLLVNALNKNPQLMESLQIQSGISEPTGVLMDAQTELKDYSQVIDSVIGFAEIEWPPKPCR